MDITKTQQKFLRSKAHHLKPVLWIGHNGLTENDAFGFFFGNSDTGLGDEEVMASFGDSGGPTIVDGKIKFMRN